MTSTEKLIRKEFKIKSEEELYALIESKSDAFFKNNFFTDRSTYLKMIMNLVNSINIDGAAYLDYLEMAKSGSILESAWTSAGVRDVKSEYVAKRKKLVNHVRFFVK
jgi:hypothetical protein